MTQRGFQCFPSSPQSVTYRAELQGTREASVEDLLQDMQQWIQDGASFPVQLQILTVDSSCDVGIRSFTEPECRADGSNEQSMGVIVGVTIGSVFSLLLVTAIILVVIVVIAMRRNRQASFKLEASR